MKNRGRRAGSLPSETGPAEGSGAASTARTLLRTLDALAEGVIVHDHRGRLLDCNLAAQQILGLSVEQIAERTLLDPHWQIVQADGTPYESDFYPFRVTLRTQD